MARRDRTFSCDDIIRFYNHNLSQSEKECVIGKLLRDRIELELEVLDESDLRRWKIAVSNVRALARFLPPVLKQAVLSILDIMDLILDLLILAFGR